MASGKKSMYISRRWENAENTSLDGEKEVIVLMFGEMIRVLRKKMGWTQEELATKTGLSKSLIQKYELGEVVPNVGSLHKIADVLECPVIELQKCIEESKLKKVYFGENLRKLRQEKRLTQKELGSMCGMKDSAVRRYELGASLPKIATIEKIAAALDVSIESLYSFDSLQKEELTIGKKIRKLRKLKGMTQHQLAESVGIYTESLQKYELETRVPRFEILSKIAYALGCSITYFEENGLYEKVNTTSDATKNVYLVSQIDSLFEKYIEKVSEKIEKEDFDTSMVHEDIRIMHHLVRIKAELITVLESTH